MIRFFQTQDETAVRDISFETALFGASIAGRINDRRLISEALVGYYIRCEPQTLLVAEEQGQVMGYLTGCLNTQAYERRYALQIVPRLLGLFLAHGHCLQPSSRQLVKELLRAGSALRPIRHAAGKEYPAHCHINIRAGFQGRGLGSQLMKEFLALLKNRQIRGVHLSTATVAGQPFFAKMGFTTLDRAILPPILGQPRHELWIMGKKID